MEMILGSDDVDADTAAAWGMVNRSVEADRLWSFVDRLASRIAKFPPDAVASAKAAVLRADGNLEADLLAESGEFNRLLGAPPAQTAMRNFMERGGQTVAGESRLGELGGEIQ